MCYLIPETFPFGPNLPITEVAIHDGFLITFRFLIIITGSAIFTATTHPNEFVHSLNQIGIPYRYAFALGIATSTRGADHLRSRPTLEIFLRLPKEVRERIYGKGIPNDPTSYKAKEKTVYFSDNIFAAIDCLGVCKFICHGFNSPHFIDYTWMKRLIHCVSGWSFKEKDIQEVGKRVIDVERTFNNREGINREHDTLPKRYFDDPMPLKVTKGHHIDRKEFDSLLTRYYKLRGWTDDGLVKKNRVKELEALK